MLRNQILAAIAEKPGIGAKDLMASFRDFPREFIHKLLRELFSAGVIEMCGSDTYRLREEHHSVPLPRADDVSGCITPLPLSRLMAGR